MVSGVLWAAWMAERQLPSTERPIEEGESTFNFGWKSVQCRVLSIPYCGSRRNVLPSPSPTNPNRNAAIRYCVP